MELFGDKVQRLGRQYVNRQRDYTNFVITVQHHLVHMYRSRAQLLAEHAQQHPPPVPPHMAEHLANTYKWIQIHTPTRHQVTTHPELPILQRLLCRKHVATATVLCNQRPGTKHIMHFLQHLKIIPLTPPKHNSATRQGRTWIELFIVYHLLGFPRIGGAQRQHEAQTKDSLGEQLQLFRLQVRRMVKLTHPTHFHRLFTGSHAGQPLLHLGITTHLTMLPLELALQPEVEKEIAIRILQSQATCTHKAATARLEQQQWVRQARFRTKGRCKWVSSLPKWPSDIYQENGPPEYGPPGKPFPEDNVEVHLKQDCGDIGKTFPEENVVGPAPSTAATADQGSTPPPTHPPATGSGSHEDNPEHLQRAPTQPFHARPQPNIIMLSCPICHHVTDGTKSVFTATNLKQRTWCRACKKSRFVHLWQCSCKVPWHSCAVHQGEPERLRSKGSSTSSFARASSSTTTAPRHHPNRPVGHSQVQEWLRHPGKERENHQTEVVFSSQEVKKARTMILHRGS